MKKIIVLLLSITLLFSTSSVTFATNITHIIGDNNIVIFTDVKENHWAKKEIDYFTSQNIVSGNGDGTFAPGEGVTREEFCKMLVLTFKAPLQSQAEPTFSDVGGDRWSYSYVEACREFLTAYQNPFGGKPAFHPKEDATREDIAVALVRMMGLTDKDVKDVNYAKKHFIDANSISPNLLPYVSLAAERGLITGYPNGTFAPSNGITRAETVVLLNRTTKDTLTDIQEELELISNVVYSPDGKTATIYIEAEEGTTLTVNDAKVEMSSNFYDNKYEGAYVHVFEEEGEKIFTIEGKNAGKTRTIEVWAKYEADAPVITLDHSPSSVSTEEITFTGKVTDKNDTSVKFYINDIEETVSSYNDVFSKTFTLKDGENTFTFKAINALEKETVITKKVTLEASSPTVKLDYIPDIVTTKQFIFSGKVTDKNDDYVKMYINDEEVNVSSKYDDFYKTLILNEGENTITFKAINALGKETVIIKTVNFGVGAPIIRLDNVPNSVTAEQIIFSGKVTDKNDEYVKMYINDEEVSVNRYYNQFSKSYTLNEGENTFTFKAINDLGKETEITKTVTFGIDAPKINMDYIPDNVTTEKITLSGEVTDKNDEYVKMYINDEEVNVDIYYNDFSKSFTLDEGENTFTFKAINEFGKETVITKTINYM